MEPEIDHINRYVSNVEEHVSFYSQVLGYEIIDHGIKEDHRRYAILKGCGHELFISERHDASPDDMALRHVGYVVDDVDKLLGELKEKGLVESGKEVILKPYSRQFYIEDPDGNEIDLIQWTDKKQLLKRADHRQDPQKKRTGPDFKGK
jgi:catechol 2,3-dioxygenase-like lactoylglutathione lyase family enzyme